ncbi:MAG: tetratricopeptide repeat protein [Hyphomicrobiales bacterium]|nr:tetratricopeptide repeat protein [Hyphomicrobiales bacterium]
MIRSFDLRLPGAAAFFFIASITGAAAATPAMASAPQTQSAKAVPVQQSQQSGPELRLPGLPPIKLPPGTKVFGPNGESTAPTPPARPNAGQNSSGREGSNAASSGKSNTTNKKQAAKKPVSRDAVLTELFQRLAKAKSRMEARAIVASIEQTWLQSGSDTADLLMRRALQAMKKKNHKLAIDLLDKVIFLEPNWAEVWNQRATARYYTDDPDGAVADVAQVLAREPRHFAALVGLGFILRRANQEKMALQVFRRALAINPQLTNIKSIIEKLQVSVEGHGI